MQTGYPGELILLGVMEGATKKDESHLHYVFSNLRMGGEWFRNTGKLSEFLAEWFLDDLHEWLLTPLEDEVLDVQAIQRDLDNAPNDRVALEDLVSLVREEGWESIPRIRLDGFLYACGLERLTPTVEGVSC